MTTHRITGYKRKMDPDDTGGMYSVQYVHVYVYMLFICDCSR